MKNYFSFLLLFLSLALQGQYAPGAGVLGTTAIHQDSNIFVGWATQVQITQGWINTADTSLGKASYGSAQSAMGKADNDVVSLGDAGMALLSFAHPITNGPGWDFAVFENSFDGHFLELAFVEVSSDGQNFFRFPAHSLTQDSTQIAAFDTIDPTKINNLAGKYRVGFGTPFDLSELDSIQGLDINNIQKVRIIDVVGSLNPLYATYDTAGNRINDPWPMSFASSGFDLDAVGVIHQAVGFSDKNNAEELKIFPNPASDRIYFSSQGLKILKIEIYNSSGIRVELKIKPNNFSFVDIRSLPQGFYFLNAETENGKILKRKFVIAR